MNKIRVMLVEGDYYWQKLLCIRLKLELDIEVIHIAATKEEAVEAARSMTPDIILMDIRLSQQEHDGLEAAKEISRMQGNKSKIIVLTSLAETDVILKAFQHGAVNYLNKASCLDIVQAIREAYHGSASIHSDAASIIRNELRLMALTPMEREVYELYQKGLSKTQISVFLQKSFNTIKTQIRSIKNKIGR